MQPDEADRLKALRAHRDLPADLDVLAEEAAEKGRLCDAEDAAQAKVWLDITSSSQPSAIVPGWRLPPDGLYANFPNVTAAYYEALRRTLLSALRSSP